MESKQPNFEKIKTAFYQAFAYNNTNIDIIILYDQIKTGTLLPVFHLRLREFKKDFNTWLDNLDIRCAGQLIDGMIKHNIKISGWMKNKSYIIDYNKHGLLDLIII